MIEVISIMVVCAIIMIACCVIAAKADRRNVSERNKNNEIEPPLHVYCRCHIDEKE